MATPTSVEALVPGDHACLTFTDPDERVDIVAAFVRDGLRGRTKVICLTESIQPDRLAAELAERAVPVETAMRSGQLSIYSSDESWLADRELSAANMIDRIGGYLGEADQQGYAGVRLAADMSWVRRPIAAADELPVFESEVNKLFGDGRLTAVCQYDRESFDAVTLAFAAATHPRTVAAAVYYEDPVLRICRQHSPPGVRLAGEIDFNHVDELTLALSEALRLDDDITVSLGRLRFIDVAAATAIAQAGLSVPAGRLMSIVCRGAVQRTLQLVGAARAGGRVVSWHARAEPTSASTDDGGAGARAHPGIALDQTFDGDSLFQLRSAVAAHGSDLGVVEPVLADLVLVAHELASNAVRHGGVDPNDPGRLRLWRDGADVMCEVSDNGPGLADPDGAGRFPPPPGASGGRGLWIIRQVVRDLAIVTGPNGTTVTAAVSVDGTPAAS
jgi:anti-sigma regulatory factor (Ser/Thr protein kinase)/anti-anti-sigma regulatory factor